MTNKNKDESIGPTSAAKLNSLRAAVLGANDGIVSTSSVVMGVAGATNNTQAIFTAGMAALVAGALSMAVGEYVSVSSQSDAEKAYIEKERQNLKKNPDRELAQLTESYVDRGVSWTTAAQVAKELTNNNALKAHLQIQFNIDEEDLNSPMQAAVASLFAFIAGGIVPFLAVIFSPEAYKIPLTVVAVVVALVITGYLSAYAGGASKLKAVTRVISGGLLAMAITYLIGYIFGTTVL